MCLDHCCACNVLVSRADKVFGPVNAGSSQTRETRSYEFSPVTLFGLKMHSNPFKFDFILNTGDTGLGPDNVQIEAEKLIKYFMTALTVPEEDIWVNLSPHEDHRVTSAP